MTTTQLPIRQRTNAPKTPMVSKTTKKPARALVPVKAPAPVEDRWKAVRRGKVYCSPACGHNCTFAEYEAAVRGAHDLMELLNQRMPGWRAHVWENMGWNYSVQWGTPEPGSAHGGLLEVHPIIEKYTRGKGGATKLLPKPIVTSYWAALQTATTFGQIVSRHRKSPLLAVADVRAELAARAAQVNRILKEISA
jgi:hypothetical protein